MKSSTPRVLVLLSLTALLGLGCASPYSPLTRLAAFETPSLRLEAQGPGTLFPSVESAAVDALTYSYLQALDERGAERLRAGTIYRVGTDYRYDEVHRASVLQRHRISYTLKPRDVARFHSYPRDRDFFTNRANERPSQVDRRSVSVVDPLHRPLYILHPSLAIREYSGEDNETREVANLRRSQRAPLIAGR
jgi:hypothetical protein